MKKTFFVAIAFCYYLLTACQKNTPLLAPAAASLYFPPVSGNTWETVSPTALGWNEAELNRLYTYLQQKNTKAFIILKDGKIAVERYFGRFTADSIWYWASAGKTITALLVGIAQKEGLLRISDRTSQYLGNGWTSLPLEKENLITIRHQLTMTTGLNDAVPDDDCTLRSCLQYAADAGTRWAYHNAPYTLLEKVVEAAARTDYNTYFQRTIRNQIGMTGLWIKVGFNNVYLSNARSMARFGLLLLNRGKWGSTPILDDDNYFNDMINSSQQLNPSYGYLTWLNGKSTHMLPTVRMVFNGALVPNAPADMYAALGKNDQKIYIVPSKNIVIVRMGESAGNVQLAASSFDSELWEQLNKVIR
ncbi:MAG: serine hydrolase [Cytophagales bacterium]|nr:beta-lactamase family protein [Bernardetiaceae bacterium]MDW8204595.1 serine hydrolase [Cytophagales bacterium]